MNFSRPDGGPVDRTIRIGGGDRLRETITEILELYLWLMDRHMPDLSDAEWCAVFDALGEDWSKDTTRVADLPKEVNAAVSIDNLDLKWEIDAARLRNRLDRTTPVEQVAISAMSEAFWFHFNEDTHYPSLIQELNGLFRSTAPPAEIQRPRRLMPALLKRDGEKAGARRTAPQQDPPSQDQPITSPGDRAPTEGPEEMDGVQDAPPPRDNGDAETPGEVTNPGDAAPQVEPSPATLPPPRFGIG